MFPNKPIPRSTPAHVCRCQILTVHILKCGSTLLQERYMNVGRGGLAHGFECYTTTSCFLSSLKPELSEKSKIIDFRSIIRNIQLIEVWGSSQKQYISLLYSNFLLYKDRRKCTVLKGPQTSMSWIFLIIERKSIIFDFSESSGFKEVKKQLVVV